MRSLSHTYSIKGDTSLSEAKGVFSRAATPFVPQGVPPRIPFQADLINPRMYSHASWAFFSAYSMPTVCPSTTGSGWHSS
jgi:hypothetical protein